MIFELPQKVLKRGYLRDKLTEEEFLLFKKCFDKLIHDLKFDESEEFNKNVVADFFRTIGYSEINTKKRVDLAIYKDDNPEVLIEFKSLKNSFEMVSKDNFNTKALHEIVLYYFREKIQEKNLSIRNLIITNGFDWFIIDAIEFEKIASLKKLEKLYIEFEIDKKSVLIKTEDFYKAVYDELKDNNILENFKVVYINFRDSFDNYQLQNIYKILSKPHLLKEYDKSDSNTLNREFYLELLHIFGLEETSGKKKLIQRKSKEKRELGSMMEISILKLQTEFQINNDEQLFNIALELNISWLNRILFLKLLEAKLLNIHNGDYPRFLSYVNTNSFGKLNTLFFEVLAFDYDKRFSVNIEIYKNTPYLNSSLFETTKLEQEFLRISNLNDNLQLKKYKTKDVVGTLEYLLDFLNSYNFGDDSSEFKNSDLINSAVLGLIFEKLNGYKDGSFFTPAFITMYMSRETIQKVVIEKFNNKYNFNCKNLSDLYNEKFDKIEANNLINSITIVDPAVGSGHFLVSALNELIYIKSYLGILIDENGKRLKNINIELENDELYISDEDGENFRYLINKSGKVSDEVKRIQKTIFNEKLHIIENQLFGVDININSVNIARLRLWIELLKESYYENNKLVTLPNIDINIKVGNSLISKYELDIKIKLENYKELVNKYRNGSRNRQAIDILQNKFRSELKYSLSESIKLRELLSKYIKEFGLFKEYIPKSNLDSYLKEAKLDIYNLIDTGNHSGKIVNLHDSLILQAVKLTNSFSGTMLIEMMEEKELLKYSEKAKKSLKPIIELENEINYIENGEIYKNAFEWRFEFPESLDNDGNFIGFDIVLGNPPYGVELKDGEKDYFLKKYKSAKSDKNFKGSTNSYSLFIERGLQISKNGYLNFIVPLSVTSSESISQLHNIIYNSCEKIKISSYSDRPTKIFPDEAEQRVAIIELKNSGFPTKELLTTTFNKRYAKTAGKDMMKSLHFIDSFGFQKYGRIPKVGEKIEIDILKKLFSLPKRLSDYYIKNGENVFYRTSGGRYYNLITNFSTGSSKESHIKVDEKYRDLIGSILSSSLYYWFYSAYSNALDLKSAELEMFPLNISAFSNNEIIEISKIYNEYMIDLQKNSYVEGGFRRYIARKSKHLIDQIDLAIYSKFGLNIDEVNFIINFSSEFRISANSEE